MDDLTDGSTPKQLSSPALTVALVVFGFVVAIGLFVILTSSSTPAPGTTPGSVPGTTLAPIPGTTARPTTTTTTTTPSTVASLPSTTVDFDDRVTETPDLEPITETTTAFLNAWLTPGDIPARTAALAPHTTSTLLAKLVGVPPEKLPAATVESVVVDAADQLTAAVVFTLTDDTHGRVRLVATAAGWKANTIEET